MLAVRAIEAGGPDVLQTADIERPAPGRGEVLVRHEAIGVNFIDTYQRSGLYPTSYPAVLGQEAAGIVEALGAGVTRFAVGDRVAYYDPGAGAYAEYHAVNADRAAHVPPGVSSEIAAASLVKGMTAEALLRRCYQVQSGQAILIHAAAGGVGTIMTQWAKHLGATVIGTVGSDDKVETAQRLGCDHVIVYRREDVAARVREITGGVGVAVSYDSIGKDTFEASLGSLATRGMYVTFGNASGPVPAFTPARLQAAGSLFMTRPMLSDYTTAPGELDASAAALFDMILAGKIEVEIGQRFKLADARAAHEALHSRSTIGATVLLL